MASRPDIHFIDTPHARLRARVQVVPGAPAVILMPDAPNTIEHYDPYFALWAGELTVVAVEMPGFGFSWANHPEALTYPGAVDAIAHALRGLDLGAMVVTGPCTLAYVAIGVAAAMPKETLGVVASQATDIPSEREWVRRAIDPEGWLRVPLIGQMAWSQPELRERLAIDGWYRAAAGPSTDIASWRDTARWAHNCGCCNALATQIQTWFGDATPDVPRVDCPGVILFGQGDRTHRGSDPKGLQVYLPRAEVRLLAQAGHFPDLEDQSAFQSAVTDLLKAAK
ncbi:MAG: alpha/beta fold hydrolase [Phenylobacterium sp.]|uniref:alpha/beta fold hydrolase n=1 Tax=Phenylobacterium sp. TaxID=1871053 RepID=UPI0027342BE2|nr:alpha/beta fold hydrolase [Phenylobacterium sp.]MDP3749927.1 alpha/beta fold hydrolase [Phenylobacterium sp.]